MAYREMTAAEKAKLKELLAKQEADEKHNAEFLKEAKRKQDEVAKALGLLTPEEAKAKADKAAEEARATVAATYAKRTETADRLATIAKQYGCSVSELLTYIATPRQVEYYQQRHEQGGQAAGASRPIQPGLFGRN